MAGLRDQWQGWKTSPSFWLATWFGTGLIRPAPGTWGTLGGVPLFYGLLQAVPDKVAYLLITAGLYMIAVVATDWAQRASKTQDNGEIVIDEVVGLLCAGLPLVGQVISPVDILLAFLLFRLFDIAKPYPVSVLDRSLKGAHGVMVDDVAAGFMAAMALQALKIMGV